MTKIVRSVASGDIAMVALSASEAMTEEDELVRITHTLERVCRTKAGVSVLGGEALWPQSPKYAQRMGRSRDFHELLVGTPMVRG